MKTCSPLLFPSELGILTMVTSTVIRASNSWLSRTLIGEVQCLSISTAKNKEITDILICRVERMAERILGTAIVCRGGEQSAGTGGLDGDVGELGSLSLMLPLRLSMLQGYTR
ncbi:unnamed protein product [Ixodes pacificus]